MYINLHIYMSHVYMYNVHIQGKTEISIKTKKKLSRMRSFSLDDISEVRAKAISLRPIYEEIRTPGGSFVRKTPSRYVRCVALCGSV